MQTLTVEIAPDGSLSIDAAGFTGADCEQATAFLEEALGRVADRRSKPGRFRCGRTARRQRLGGTEA
jgi:hypothetical protein